MIHFGTEKALKEVPTSERIPNEMALKFETIDMAYNEYDGLFDCEMNKIALSKIVRLAR